ncbi:DMT family transporter [Brevibacterium album]|uniref:DMT family transporter n=1 Tax=Brevibacterium album TaxID=417948 RepID=UPI0004265EAC|nr:EamA family transporter [Brevibacterium album]
MRWAGALLGLLGVALLVNGAAGGLDTGGVVASLLAMASSSLGFVLTKRWRPPVSPFVFTSWQLSAAGLLLVPAALLVEGVPRPLADTELAAFAYVGLIATAMAYIAWFSGLARLPAGTVGIVGLLNPLTGALLGLAAAGERLSAPQWAGALLIVGGVALGLVVQRPSAEGGSASRARV